MPQRPGRAQGAADNFADGAAFVVQNDPRGLHAVSLEPGNGSAKGYYGSEGVINSVAVVFDIHGEPGIQWGQNGGGTATVDIYPVEWAKYNPVHCIVNYDSDTSTLSLSLEDSVTHDTWSGSHVVDVAGAVGQDTCVSAGQTLDRILGD